MRTFLAVAFLGLALACGAPSAPVDGAPATVGAITVANAVARPPLGGQTTGAGYLVIRNGADLADRLVGASSPAAASIELHTHRQDNGVMRMERVEAIDVPAGEDVVFAPRGLHLMLFGFSPQGDVAPITLRFERAGEVTVDFAVTPLGQP